MHDSLVYIRCVQCGKVFKSDVYVVCPECKEKERIARETPRRFISIVLQNEG